MTDADDVTERARRLRQRALSDPDAVDVADLRAVLSARVAAAAVDRIESGASDA